MLSLLVLKLTTRKNIRTNYRRGNVDFTNQLSMNLGFGAKQILAGKVDNKNETYLSGQVGLKYKF